MQSNPSHPSSSAAGSSSHPQSANASANAAAPARKRKASDVSGNGSGAGGIQSQGQVARPSGLGAGYSQASASSGQPPYPGYPNPSSAQDSSAPASTSAPPKKPAKKRKVDNRQSASQGDGELPPQNLNQWVTENIGGSGAGVGGGERYLNIPGGGGAASGSDRGSRQYTPSDDDDDIDQDLDQDKPHPRRPRDRGTPSGSRLNEAYKKFNNGGPLGGTRGGREESRDPGSGMDVDDGGSVEGGNGGGGGKKGKRNRVHFSCVECHRRKQKCDRQEPCGQCIARKVPNLCKPFINGIEDPTVYDSDIKGRLSRIEDVLATLITRLPAQPQAVPEDHSDQPRASSSRHSGNRNIHSPRPIAPAPPGGINLLQQPGNARSRGKGSVLANGQRASPATELGGMGHATEQMHQQHRQGQGQAGNVDVQTMFANGMEALVQNNGGEEVFHPRGSRQQASSGQQAMDSGHTPPVPLYFSSVHSYPSPGDHPSPQSYSGSVIAPGIGRVRITLEPATPELLEILSTLGESGITKSVIVGLLMDLPDKSLSDSLVELYFREIDWTRYKINRPSFMSRYSLFFESIRHNPSNPHIDADTLKWLPLMYIILAIATLSAPEEMAGGSAGQISWSRRFYGSSRSALTCAKALQRDNLDIVYASLLTARYMFLTRRAAEGSTPLTSAFQLGLYRDGSVLNLTDKREIELRRRAWAMVYHLDRTNALLVGRPTSISDLHTDTQEPANLDDDEVESGAFDPRGHPMTQPTEYTQVILRHRLAQIMGKISDHTFAIKLPEYSTVLKLDQELLDWQSKLPPFFALFHPDTSFDRKYHYIFVQRHLLACEFLFARITLHRPYLLRKRDRESNNQYRYSREAAIESAKADLLGRRSFIFEKPQDLKVNSGGYRVLNSYIVLGVAIKMEPKSQRAEELRRLLDVVAGLAPDELGRVSEPIVKDELAIVEFLTQRANDPDARNEALNNSAPIPPYDHLIPSDRQSIASDTSRERRPSDVMQISPRPMASDDPAWSFVAPGMAGIDVHAPFAMGGSHQGSSSHLTPGPLRPPTGKNRPANINTAPWNDDRASDTSHRRQRSSSAMSHDTLQSSFLRPPPHISPHQQAHMALQATPIVPEAVLQNFDNGSNADFDFDNSTMGNVDAWWNDIGTNLSMNQNTPGNFNPFALAQFGEGGEVDNSNETAFLNMLLSTIANSNATGNSAL